MAAPPQGAGARQFEVLFLDLLETRITTVVRKPKKGTGGATFGCGQERTGLMPDVFVPIYAQTEHMCPISGKAQEVAMPVVKTVAPLRERPPAPTPAAAGGAALARFGALPAPQL